MSCCCVTVQQGWPIPIKGRSLLENVDDNWKTTPRCPLERDTHKIEYGVCGRRSMVVGESIGNLERRDIICVSGLASIVSDRCAF